MKNLTSLFNKNQFKFQSVVFWFAAILNIGSDRFWMFAIAGIAWSAVDSILSELRTLNENNK